ncbi:MAG: tetratricopeptide repeat protein [Myxococcaceae bacterium]|nr:tetratricopeptide repeat protein [Myxococcaceae bacterium]
MILTALPVEYRAVRAHLSDLREDVHAESTVYERGRFSSEKGVWEVLIAELGVGNPRAAFETERALEHFNPHVALFVGVAGGLKDVSIGDVVFAPKVYFYESAKVLSGLKPRPDVGESSYALAQRARAEARKEDWLRRLIGPTLDTAPRVLAGPLAAGEKVLAEARSELYQFLRAHYDDALAVEMEGRGFLMAAHARQGVEALVIRGISDRLDDKQQADAAGSQELASRHASAFAFELLARFAPLGGELALQRFRAEEQGALWSVPYPRNPHFTGRDALLRDIRAHFLADASPLPLALHGLGGVGKTQLALEYASRHASDEHHYSHVLWLRADEPSVLASKGEKEQARARFTRALAMHEHVFGPEHPRVAGVLNNLGVLLMNMGELPQARLHLERAVAIDEKAYGPDHPEVATDLANLASVLIKAGEKEQGRARLQRALSIYDQHPDLPASEALPILVVLGKTHYKIREWASARSYLERALSLLDKVPEEEPQRFELLLMLGSSLRHMEEYAEAVTWLERARALPGEGRDPRLLCDLLLLLGIWRALAIRERTKGPSSLRVAQVLQYLAEVKFFSMRFPEAEADVRRALSIYAAIEPPPKQELAEALLLRGGLHQRAGALQQAQADVEQAVSLLESIPGKKEYTHGGTPRVAPSTGSPLPGGGPHQASERPPAAG